MRSLYWKIFISFWLATILIILTTAWVTSEIARKSSIPAQEREFMDNYANAAIVTFEAGRHDVLLKWLKQAGLKQHMNLFLLTSQGDIIGHDTIPPIVAKVSDQLKQNQLDQGLFKTENVLVSHEILSTSGMNYRLAAVGKRTSSYFVQIPWAGLSARLLIAISISGLICYLLSLYLTQPLRSLRMAAKSIGTGQLNTRVGRFAGHHNDEIAELSSEFDRMAEQLETLINTKQRLLQDISHELRSPLTRLQIAIELGRQKCAPIAINEFNRMEEECLRLNALIGEALEFARLDKSPHAITKSTVALKALLTGAVSDANYECSLKKPRVLLAPMNDVELLLDGRLLHRAIENVLRNALRYSPEDQMVLVSLHKDSTPPAVVIDIADNGPGVPEDQLTKIFSPFYRVDTAREKKTGGYGLGLAIAERAVALHGGTIKAYNQKNGGLLVRIVLPLVILGT